nr:hypothetical protein [Micromonospora sp. DSM 115978]
MFEYGLDALPGVPTVTVPPPNEVPGVRDLPGMPDPYGGPSVVGPPVGAAEGAGLHIWGRTRLPRRAASSRWMRWRRVLRNEQLRLRRL